MTPPSSPLPPAIPEGATFYDAAALALAHRDRGAEWLTEGAMVFDQHHISLSRRFAIRNANAVQHFWARAATLLALQQRRFSTSGLDSQPWAQRIRSLVLANVTVAEAKQECQRWAERLDAGPSQPWPALRSRHGSRSSHPLQPS